MSLRIVSSALRAEEADEPHVARLLLLLRHARTRGDGTIAGITKLAKMDFFLRYPSYLQRLIDAEGRSALSVDMEEFEADTVESRMIRFRYGPWDGRYRRWIGILAAKGLAQTFVKGHTVYVRVTETGAEAASAIADLDSFAVLDLRARTVEKAVGALSATKLKNLVYEVVPEILGLPWGAEIPG